MKAYTSIIQATCVLALTSLPTSLPAVAQEYSKAATQNTAANSRMKSYQTQPINQTDTLTRPGDNAKNPLGGTPLMQDGYKSSDDGKKDDEKKGPKPKREQQLKNTSLPGN